jgi:tyrosine-protein kinase Etk/Wzc
MPSSINQDADVSLLDYLLVLSKHSRLILYVSAAAGLLTLLILLLVPNKYTATARFLPPQTNQTLSGQLLDELGGTAIPGVRRGGAGEMLGGLLGLKQPANIYVGIMAGDYIADRIIERFKLITVYKKKYKVEVRQQLRQRVKPGIGEKDGLLFIVATDESPQRAADLANAYVEELDQQLKKLALQEAVERLAFLEKEFSLVGQNLVKAEEALRSFSEKNSVVQIDAQAKGIIEYIANLRATIDAREVELQVLRQRATPSNFDVIRLETELKGLKEKLRDAESQESVNPGKSDLMMATGKVPVVGLAYARLYREAKYQEGLYRLYVKLAEIARLDQVRNFSLIQIIDRATPPEKKSSPRRLTVTLMVTGVIFIIMTFVAFALEYWQAALSESNAERRGQLQHYSRWWRQDFRWFLEKSHGIGRRVKKIFT